MITLSGIRLLNIGAPFWGLAGGTMISLLLETRDFRDLGAQARLKGTGSAKQCLSPLGRA